MNEEQQGDLFEELSIDDGGAFDDQLVLPFPAERAPTAIVSILKRDGREEPFDKAKIAEAILRAGREAGREDGDLAQSLAAAVAIYLTKTMGAATPSVDHVHDAVERVLIQMSQAKIALAYARYRDRRARIRRLRNGDMASLLGDLEEARRTRQTQPEEAALLTVRTSAERLTAWDGTRITEALVRETGLDRPMATVIAEQVEQQITGAGIETLTTALVRELVCAKLIEHGLADYQERHRRMGLPVYDCERILRGGTEETVGQDPTVTDRVLARAVKKEYALSEVFPRTAAEAHLAGDFHLHHLDRIDRLFSAEHSLEPVARFGIGLPQSPEFAGPPRHPGTLLAQMVKANAVLQGFFGDANRWWALNVLFAPYLHDKDAKAIGQFAQMLVYELAYQRLHDNPESPPAGIGLCWNPPAGLAQAEAVGPGGVLEGKTYGDYTATARQLAWAVIDVFVQGGLNRRPLAGPRPSIHVDQAIFESAGGEDFLRHAAGLAALRGNVSFRFDRGEAPIPAASWQARDAALHQVSLNLPRAAYRAGKESALLAELERVLALAAMAHQAKRDFAGRLVDGPLALLAAKRAGRAYLEVDKAACLVAVDGLNECVQVLLGNAELHASAEAQALGTRILEHLAKRCAWHSERMGLPLRLTQNHGPSVSRRFAEFDAETFPKLARTVIKIDPQTEVMAYTPGARLNPGHGLNPVEAVRIESHVQRPLGAAAQSAIHLPFENASADTTADFIKKVFRTTDARAVAVAAKP